MNKEELLKKVSQIFSKEGAFDIIRLANELGIVVYYKKDLVAVFNSLFKKDFNAKIQYNLKRKNFEIFVNPFHSLTRQRFSIAHEIAHYILHKEEIQKQEEGISRQNLAKVGVGLPGVMAEKNDLSKSQLEKEADELAAEMLMPREIVEDFMHKNGFSREVPLEKEQIKKTAEYFKVSPLVVIIRLRHLNFVVPYIEFS